MSAVCPGCQDTRWTPAGLCFICESPQPTRRAIADRVAKGQLSVSAAHGELDELDKRDIVGVLSVRPPNFEACNTSALPAESRAKIQRYQSQSRLKKVEADLEELSKSKLLVNAATWTEHSGDALQRIREEEGRLEAEHLALRQVLALPDAELIEFLDEIERERRTA